MLFNNAGITIEPLSQGILGRTQIAHSLRRVKFNPSMTLSAENIAPGFGSLPANNMEDIKPNFGEPILKSKKVKHVINGFRWLLIIKHKIEGSSPALNLTTGWQRG